MFKMVLSHSNILKTSFNAISSIVDEVQIQVDKEGLKLDALDNSHITFIHLELKVASFDEYKCDSPVHINVDTEEFMKVLKRASADDIIELGVDEDNLIISFIGEADRIFKIRLIDMEYKHPTPPEMEYPTKFEVPFELLKDSVKDIEIVSDKIMLSVDKDRFVAKAEGELGDVQVRYLHGETIHEPARSIFSLNKFKEMLKADKFTDSAIIQLGNDMPLTLTFEDFYNNVLNFILAPRVETEE